MRMLSKRIMNSLFGAPYEREMYRKTQKTACENRLHKVICYQILYNVNYEANEKQAEFESDEILTAYIKRQIRWEMKRRVVLRSVCNSDSLS